MRKVYVVGVGMTPFGVHLDTPCGELGRQAVTAAMEDAGIGPADLDVVYYANVVQGAVEGQHGVKGEHALRPIGIEGAPLINVENACTSSSAGLFIAFTQVAGGFADVALVVGAEKLNTKDRERRFATFNQPDDLAAAHAYVDTYGALVEDVQPPPEVEIDDRMRSIFMDIYAVSAKLHMKRFGTTWEQIAAVSEKNHKHSENNPMSQFQKTFTREEILSARVVSWPLTLPMCAPISDGGSAAVLCSEDALKRFDEKRAVRVLASALRSGTDHDIKDLEKRGCRVAARAAYDMAGIGPDDVSLAELHDAVAFGEISQSEMLGFCEFGEGGKLAESGATSMGGRLPINLSGGLESKGHPIGATGTGQIYELTKQMRGEAGERQADDTRIAVAVNAGGFIGIEEAATCVTILGRE